MTKEKEEEEEEEEEEKTDKRMRQKMILFRGWHLLGHLWSP